MFPCYRRTRLAIDGANRSLGVILPETAPRAQIRGSDSTIREKQHGARIRFGVLDRPRPDGGAPARRAGASGDPARPRRGAAANLDDLAGRKRSSHGGGAYAESKLHDVLLAFGVARRWPGVLSNALEPGWVATRMGGPHAPDDLDQAHRTQVWLAVSGDEGAQVTGEYFFHMQSRQPNPAVYDVNLQDRLIEACAALSGVSSPF